jgi:hypothetical protein
MDLLRKIRKKIEQSFNQDIYWQKLLNPIEMPFFKL